MRTRSRNSRSGFFTLTLPATSANLGPAFDAAALALNLFLRVQARISSEFSVIASGRDPEICGCLENHLVLRTYSEVLEANHKPILPFALRLVNEIPIGKGCGSSAAARLAGVALANRFGSLRWLDEQIVAEASRREHHPDNAAACWFGGLSVAGIDTNGSAQVARFIPKGIWPLLLAVPSAGLSTEKARRVLPEKYSRSDTVANIQNSMLLLAAFAQGRRDLLSTALEDRLHQPYRAGLCPLLPALHKTRNERGILGVALSGAGPSVLIFLDPKVEPGRTMHRIQKHLQGEGLAAELILTQISKCGARL